MLWTALSSFTKYTSTFLHNSE